MYLIVVAVGIADGVGTEDENQFKFLKNGMNRGR